MAVGWNENPCRGFSFPVASRNKVIDRLSQYSAEQEYVLKLKAL